MVARGLEKGFGFSGRRKPLRQAVWVVLLGLMAGQSAAFQGVGLAGAQLRTGSQLRLQEIEGSRLVRQDGSGLGPSLGRGQRLKEQRLVVTRRGWNQGRVGPLNGVRIDQLESPGPIATGGSFSIALDRSLGFNSARYTLPRFMLRPHSLSPRTEIGMGNLGLPRVELTGWNPRVPSQLLVGAAAVLAVGPMLLPIPYLGDLLAGFVGGMMAIGISYPLDSLQSWNSETEGVKGLFEGISDPMVTNGILRACSCFFAAAFFKIFAPTAGFTMKGVALASLISGTCMGFVSSFLDSAKQRGGFTWEGGLNGLWGDIANSVIGYEIFYLTYYGLVASVPWLASGMLGSAAAGGIAGAVTQLSTILLGACKAAYKLSSGGLWSKCSRLPGKAYKKLSTGKALKWVHNSWCAGKATASRCWKMALNRETLAQACSRSAINNWVLYMGYYGVLKLV